MPSCDTCGHPKHQGMCRFPISATFINDVCDIHNECSMIRVDRCHCEAS